MAMFSVALPRRGGGVILLSRVQNAVAWLRDMDDALNLRRRRRRSRRRWSRSRSRSRSRMRRRRRRRRRRIRSAGGGDEEEGAEAEEEEEEEEERPEQNISPLVTYVAKLRPPAPLEITSASLVATSALLVVTRS